MQTAEMAGETWTSSPDLSEVLDQLDWDQLIQLPVEVPSLRKRSRPISFDFGVPEPIDSGESEGGPSWNLPWDFSQEGGGTFQASTSVGQGKFTLEEGSLRDSDAVWKSAAAQMGPRTPESHPPDRQSVQGLSGEAGLQGGDASEGSADFGGQDKSMRQLPANAAKAQAASIIRSIFRRPEAKRQAKPLEEGVITLRPAQFGNPPQTPLNQTPNPAPSKTEAQSLKRSPMPEGPPQISPKSVADNSPSKGEHLGKPFPPDFYAQALASLDKAMGHQGKSAPGSGGQREAPIHDTASLFQKVSSSSERPSTPDLQREAGLLYAAIVSPKEASKVQPSLLDSSPSLHSNRKGPCVLTQSVNRACCKVAAVGLTDQMEELPVYAPETRMETTETVTALGDAIDFNWLLEGHTKSADMFEMDAEASKGPLEASPSSATQEASPEIDPWTTEFADVDFSGERASQVDTAQASEQQPLPEAPGANLPSLDVPALSDLSGREAGTQSFMFGREGGEAAIRSASAQAGNASFPSGASSPASVLNDLWAQLESSEIRHERFRAYREAYREELRRLKIWTATYTSPSLLQHVQELHFFACNALPALKHRQPRLMMTKGALWARFMTQSMSTASPADVYFTRHEGTRAFKDACESLLGNLTQQMQTKCKAMWTVMEDLKDEAMYGPEIYRSFGAHHVAAGIDRGFKQTTFPELNKPAADLDVTTSSPETIQLVEIELEKDRTPEERAWSNGKLLLASGIGFGTAGKSGRGILTDLVNQQMDGRVKRFDFMATGKAPTLEEYLDSARQSLGTAVNLGLAFCAMAQEMADQRLWTPTEESVAQLFGGLERGLFLASNIVRVMGDLRTYHSDLVQSRPNAVALHMREKNSSHAEAVRFLMAKSASDIDELAATIPLDSTCPLTRACWQLTFDACRTSVILYTIPESGDRMIDLFS